MSRVTIKVFITFGVALLLSGCLNITDIDQPDEVISCGEVRVVVTCAPDEGYEEYAGSLYWGFLGVCVPDDWRLTEARVDSPIKADLWENERIATLMDLCTPTQVGYQWIGLLTEKQMEFSEKMTTEPIKVKLKFIVGRKTGLFAINYHIGLADSEVVTLGGINWGNDLGARAIEVTE